VGDAEGVFEQVAKLTDRSNWQVAKAIIRAADLVLYRPTYYVSRRVFKRWDRRQKELQKGPPPTRQELRLVRATLRGDHVPILCPRVPLPKPSALAFETSNC
jgi:hypothetical protein